ncbi:Olfactory Receptor 7E24, partial [Manis pentadactyla]
SDKQDRYQEVMSFKKRLQTRNIAKGVPPTWNLRILQVSEFLLQGLSEDPELQPLLFRLFLSLYLGTVLGNLLIILAVGSDPHLHNPMYFFLSSLSLADTGFSTTTVPKMQSLNCEKLWRKISMKMNKRQRKEYEKEIFLYRYFSYMELLNLTGVSEFLLLGLSGDPELQPLLFGLFLYMYLVTVLGNLLIILAVGPQPHLHTPMYFFLSCLSLADTGFSSTTVFKMLVNIQTHRKYISYAGCLTQVSFFFLFGCLNSLLLAVIAYDWFVAICHPLHYPAIMRPHLCGLLVLLSFLISLLESQTHCLMVSKLGFCTDVEIPHYFCDIPKLLRLACSDTSTSNIVIFLVGTISGFLPISGIIFSYYRIVSSILRVPSAGGSPKPSPPVALTWPWFACFMAQT